MPKWMFEKNEDYIIQNYMLKRTKKCVGLLLKDVETKDIDVQWNNSAERKISKNILENFSERRSDCVLRSILLSRQMCILPTMLQDKLPAMIRDGEIEPTSIGDQIGTSKMDILVDTIIRQKNDEEDNDNTTGKTGKTCKTCKTGKLIFCHFRSEMDELMRRLILRGVEHTQICIFDGRVKNRERHKILKDKYEILILQIQTCCEGLNLQENYSQIYFVSPNWNPSVEEQAIARCHRYGQNKSVQVFRFYMNKSIDQYILFIQNNKRQIILDAFQQPNNNINININDID
jgi:SNF2 family DNA or RNA helicase